MQITHSFVRRALNPGESDALINSGISILILGGSTLAYSVIRPHVFPKGYICWAPISSCIPRRWWEAVEPGLSFWWKCRKKSKIIPHIHTFDKMILWPTCVFSFSVFPVFYLFVYFSLFFFQTTNTKKNSVWGMGVCCVYFWKLAIIFQTHRILIAGIGDI